MVRRVPAIRLSDEESRMGLVYADTTLRRRLLDCDKEIRISAMVTQLQDHWVGLHDWVIVSSRLRWVLGENDSENAQL